MASTGRRDKTRKVAVVLEEETPLERWMRRLRLSGFTVVALVLVTVAVIVLAPSLRTLIEQRQQIAALEREVAAQRAEVSDLEAELDRWTDPAYIESQARQRLLYVYPGEATYVITGEATTGAAQTASDFSTQITTTRVDWVAGLLGATLEAGLTASAADELSLVGETAQGGAS